MVGRMQQPWIESPKAVENYGLIWGGRESRSPARRASVGVKARRVFLAWRAW